MPNPDEVAVINVNGVDFQDWLTVFVQQQWTEAFPIFRFTCAEREPVTDLWTTLRLRPPNECAITLGGQPAVHGVILTRQVAYDANNHAVQLTGRGRSWYASKSSVLSKTGNFDGKTFEEVAKEVAAPYGGIETIGEIDATPFKRLQVEPGEKVWDFLERLARVRRVIMGSTAGGKLLMIGDHTAPIIDVLQEGVNILSCQCIISEEEKYIRYDFRGQTASSDDQHGRDAGEQEASAKGSAPVFSVLVTMAEQPVWGIGELQTRAQAEAQWHEGTWIEANIVVQGWLTSSGKLWEAGNNVKVISPMALLNQVLKIQTATFEQSSEAGTTTTLTLVAPWYLNDFSSYDFGRPGILPAPEPGTSMMGTPPSTPPAKEPE